MAKHTRRYLLLNITFIGMENSPSKRNIALVDRLRDFAYKRLSLAKGIATLVLCMHWLRSVLAYINSVLDGPMAAVEKDESMPAVPACEWCRMGVHKKCDRLRKLHAICICDCERGY